MNVVTYLQNQFSNLNTVLHSIVGDLTDEEWLTRPVPGLNRIGYTVWHIPRTQDSFLHTWIRGQAEIVHSDRWAHWGHLKPLGIGVSISLEQADEITRTVRLADAITYADEVHEAMLAWLAQISEVDLDQVPDVRRHLAAYPEYQTPSYLEEVNNVLDIPVWGLLMKPCLGHLHRHLGELEITKDILRNAR